MKHDSNLILGYLFVVGTAFFTAFSYIFGKMVSDDLYPETVTFYWFLGAFLVAIINGIILIIFLINRFMEFIFLLFIFQIQLTFAYLSLFL